MRRRHLAVALAALGLGLVLVLLRGEPRWNGDQGVFLSIAARVLDGDRLYADVIDNKDPLFFYTHTGALWIGGWKGPAALDGLWFAIAALSMTLFLRELRAPTPAVVAGFVLYPLALTASWYEPGLSMLGGLAFAPLAGWLWLRGNFGLAGAALGVTALFKITVGPIAAAPLLAFVLLGAPSGERARGVLRAAVGLLATFVVVGAFLGARGELRGYLEVLAFNVEYPDDARQVQGSTGGFGSHLPVVREYFRAAGRWQWPAALLALVLLASAGVVGWRRAGRTFQLLVGATFAVVLAAVFTVAATAIWVHHLQLLALPASLIAAVVIACAAAYHTRLGIVVAVACVAFASWSSAKHEVRSGALAGAWSSGRSSVGADLLEAARRRFHSGDDRVTYMVFGSNSENAHAVFIDDSFDLECRWFHLYPNNAPKHLDETSRCATDKRPELVLVTVGFFESRGGQPAWDSFVAGARRFLDSRYELVGESNDFQVWRRVGEPEGG